MEKVRKRMKGLVDCSMVYVDKSDLGGCGVFAGMDFRKGEVVEFGIVRKGEGLDGQRCPYLFVWSEDHKNYAIGSGCSTFYNHSQKPNVEILRDYERDEFKIVATQDIKIGEELTHSYIGIDRKCYEELRKELLED